MAEADDAERTEAPTPRRLQEARERGQVAKSQDLTAGIMLLLALIWLQQFGQQLFKGLYQLTAYLLGDTAEPLLQAEGLTPLAIAVVGQMSWMMLPMLLGLMVVGVLVVLLQTGFLYTLYPLKPDLNKINPLKGLQRIFSSQTLVLLLINCAKLGIVGAVVYYTLVDDIDRMLMVSTLSFGAMFQLSAEIFFRLAFRVAVLLLILGIIDWIYQRYKHARSLRMTKEEIKEEMRRMEGDPLMKRRRREVQMKLAMQRLRRVVPQADVVVTNPTHYAVALQYDAARMAAPKVIAKGEDFLAQRIRELAIAAGVPVIERKPLAQALYKLVEIGQEVPPSLYRAVAEVLAYVYELSGKRRQLMNAG
ncbi:MAG: Flagellar biosynthetic protein FlhB [Phycisphaerae bacterium]|nr:Flagellar biosynthetic protein FlhB [Phycisphaerae bacterium]